MKMYMRTRHAHLRGRLSGCLLDHPPFSIEGVPDLSASFAASLNNLHRGLSSAGLKPTNACLISSTLAMPCSTNAMTQESWMERFPLVPMANTLREPVTVFFSLTIPTSVSFKPMLRHSLVNDGSSSVYSYN